MDNSNIAMPIFNSNISFNFYHLTIPIFYDTIFMIDKVSK